MIKPLNVVVLPLGKPIMFLNKEKFSLEIWTYKLNKFRDMRKDLWPSYIKVESKGKKDVYFVGTGSDHIIIGGNISGWETEHLTYLGEL